MASAPPSEPTYDRAEAAYLRGDYTEAAQILEELAQELPDDPSVLLLYGHVLYCCQQYAAARPQYERVLQLTEEPDFVTYAQQGLQAVQQLQSAAAQQAANGEAAGEAPGETAVADAASEVPQARSETADDPFAATADTPSADSAPGDGDNPFAASDAATGASEPQATDPFASAPAATEAPSEEGPAGLPDEDQLIAETDSLEPNPAALANAEAVDPESQTADAEAPLPQQPPEAARDREQPQSSEPEAPEAASADTPNLEQVPEVPLGPEPSGLPEAEKELASRALSAGEAPQEEALEDVPEATEVPAAAEATTAVYPTRAEWQWLLAAAAGITASLVLLAGSAATAALSVGGRSSINWPRTGLLSLATGLASFGATGAAARYLARPAERHETSGAAMAAEVDASELPDPSQAPSERKPSPDAALLYLAEVRHRYRWLPQLAQPELQLLAYQRNDSSWRATPTPELVPCPQARPFPAGALVAVTLGPDRTIWEPPQPAASQAIAQLQHFSRQLESHRQQREEIEQWRQSLAYQARELERRKRELESGSSSAPS